MIPKEALKQKYKSLPRPEREMMGTLLMKVNLGVAMPAEQRRLASFLKGSSYIANAGKLDEIIEYLHDNEKSGPTPPDEMPTITEEAALPGNSIIERLLEFAADEENTRITRPKNQ